MTVRFTPHKARIEAVALSYQVLNGTDKIAENISRDVRAATSRSKRLRQYGRRMVTSRTKTGSNAGTTWGPAVPIEFGTSTTPPKRILLTAAEKYGKLKMR